MLNFSRKLWKQQNILDIHIVIALRTKDLVGRITVNAVFFIILVPVNVFILVYTQTTSQSSDADSLFCKQYNLIVYISIICLILVIPLLSLTTFLAFVSLGSVFLNPIFNTLPFANQHFIYQLIYNMKVQNRKLKLILRPKRAQR